MAFLAFVVNLGFAFLAAWVAQSAGFALSLTRLQLTLALAILSVLCDIYEAIRRMPQ